MDAKLRNFQYKIMHHILPTNSFLSKCKIKETDKCDFCKTEKETLEHLFCQCKMVQTLWSQRLAWIHPRLKVVQRLTNVNILLGYSGNIPEIHCLNMFILITKRFIYVQKFKQKNITFSALKKYVKRYYDIMMYIA